MIRLSQNSQFARFYDFMITILNRNFNMTVLEVGIFENSLLVLSKSFHPLIKAQKTLSLHKRSHIINSIQQMSKIVLKGNLKVLNNENYRILFRIPERKNQKNVFMYAIDDRKSSKGIITALLEELSEIYTSKFPKKESTNIMVMDRYKNFLGVIDDVFSDERFTPSDRVRNYLF